MTIDPEGRGGQKNASSYATKRVSGRKRSSRAWFFSTPTSHTSTRKSEIRRTEEWRPFRNPDCRFRETDSNANGRSHSSGALDRPYQRRETVLAARVWC